MKTAIRQRALELGFDDCRFTTAQPPAGAAQFQDWLNTRQHGAMAYLERNAPKRVDPQLVLPGARSVICLAASYAGISDSNAVSNHQKAEPTHESPSPDLKTALSMNLAGFESPLTRPSDTLSPSEGERDGVSGFSQSSANDDHHALHTAPHGLVARYARFDDYHDVLGEQLRTLVKFVDQLGGEGTRSLWYVDTGPVLERDFAQRAGIGFIGKHTNVISRKLGNWIFLAEILTTLELEPDGAEKNRCGTCTRCISACPTRAITAPFQLDARLCISYLTIELKGPIPIELRPAIGNRIFGCDDCLAVCPWNRFAREGQLMRTHAKPDLATPDLLELLALDESGFKHRFSGTPMLRAKRQGMLRNACVAVGNVGDEEALPALHRIGSESDPVLAEHAHWATAQIKARGKLHG